MPAKKSTPAPAGAAPHRDLRPYVYFAFNQLFVIGYAYVLAVIIPNRMLSGQLHLWSLPVLMQVIALGAAAVFVRGAELRKIGWWLVVAGCSLLVAVTILLIIRVLISAAFLSGVYGAFGQAAAMTSLIAIALVIEVVGLLPLFQLKYMRSRAGRRAYAVA